MPRWIGTSLAVALLAATTAACSSHPAASNTAVTSPTTASLPCTSSAFYTPAPHSTLNGFRCRGLYAVAQTSSGTGGALYGGAGQINTIFYVAREGKWMAAASSGGGVYVSYKELTLAGLQPQTVALTLGLSKPDVNGFQLYVSGLGCNGAPGPGPCQVTN